MDDLIILAPAQVHEGTLDAAVDSFAFGVLLMELLLGELPTHPPESRTAMDLHSFAVGLKTPKLWRRVLRGLPGSGGSEAASGEAKASCAGEDTTGSPVPLQFRGAARATRCLASSL